MRIATAAYVCVSMTQLVTCGLCPAGCSCPECECVCVCAQDSRGTRLHVLANLDQEAVTTSTSTTNPLQTLQIELLETAPNQQGSDQNRQRVTVVLM